MCAVGKRCHMQVCSQSPERDGRAMAERDRESSQKLRLAKSGQINLNTFYVYTHTDTLIVASESGKLEQLDVVSELWRIRYIINTYSLKSYFQKHQHHVAIYDCSTN